MSSLVEAGPEAANEEVAKSKFFIRLYIVSLYFISVGVLHLWGYWPNFGVNILEFLDFSDILKVTAYPITIAILLVATGGSTGQWLARLQQRRWEKDIDVDSNRQSLSHDELNLRVSKNKKKLKNLNRVMLVIKTLYIISFIGSIIAVAADFVWGWMILAPLLSLPIATWISNHPYLHLNIKNRNLRIAVSFVIAVVPAYAYSTGKISAFNILDGKIFRYVISDIAGHTGNVSDDTLRFVGHAGDYLFLYDAKKEATVFIKLDDDKAVSLKLHKPKMDVEKWTGQFQQALGHILSSRK